MLQICRFLLETKRIALTTMKLNVVKMLYVLTIISLLKLSTVQKLRYDDMVCLVILLIFISMCINEPISSFDLPRLINCLNHILSFFKLK